MSPEAIARRLAIVEELRALSLSLVDVGKRGPRSERPPDQPAPRSE